MNNNLPVKYEESIFKKIANKIKGIFSKNNTNKTNSIEEYNTKTEMIDANKEFRNRNKANVNELNKPFDSLDYAIEQFVMIYGLRIPNAYSALTHIEANDIVPDNVNKKVEANLMSVINRMDKFTVREQKGKDFVFFHHVWTENFEHDDNADKMRIYINCKRKNVADLAGEILMKMQDDNLYLKFSSDDQLASIERSEAIVIYTDENNIVNVLNNIGDIERERPELFEGSQLMNPFAYRVGNFSYVRDIKDNQKYINKYGQEEELAKSYNTFLSRALEESFVEACKEVISKDKELAIATNGEVSDDSNFYLRHFEKIYNSEHNYRELLNKMKEQLIKAQKRNPYLDIRGISDKKGEMEHER